MKILITVALTMAIGMLGVVRVVAAETTPQPTTLEVTSESPSQAELPDLVVARLVLEDGTPVTDQPVTFYFQTELISTRYVPIGMAKTDPEGVARLPFTPRQPEYTMRASFAGSETYGSSEVDAPVRYAEARVQPLPIKHHVHSLLVPLRTIMPTAITAAVVVFWVFLLGLVTLTVIRIRRPKERSVLADTAPD